MSKRSGIQPVARRAARGFSLIEMMIAMVKHTKNILLDDIKSTIREMNQYKPIGKIQRPVFMR